MADSISRHDKTNKPYAAFVTPQQVVRDIRLSPGEKARAFEGLEQDARQLSVAAAEGMTGIELTGLHELLDPKDALALNPEHGKPTSWRRG